MPDPIKGKIIGVTVTNGSAGEKVTIRNLSRNSPVLTETLDANKQAALNTANAGVSWLAGDVVQIQIAGRINQAKQETLAGGGASVTLGNSASTTLPAVNL